MKHIKIRSLGPIEQADITLGDLTLLVGPHASGKSILLQMIKLIEDRNNIHSILKKNNFEWGKDENKFLELYFGESMSSIINQNTEIICDKKIYTKNLSCLNKA
jgi:predicted ATPase